MPTAYLSPSQLQDLTNVSSTAPVSGDNGKALVWNQAAGQWQAEQVAYSNLSGAPTIPTVNNGQLSLGVSGNGLTGSQTFTANQSGNATFTVASNATANNTANTIVFRDNNSNFQANQITVKGLKAEVFREGLVTKNSTDFGNYGFGTSVDISACIDRLYRADQRYTVTSTNINGVGNTFDGSNESVGVVSPQGTELTPTVATIEIDFLSGVDAKNPVDGLVYNAGIIAVSTWAGLANGTYKIEGFAGYTNPSWVELVPEQNTLFDNYVTTKFHQSNQFPVYLKKLRFTFTATGTLWITNLRYFPSLAYPDELKHVHIDPVGLTQRLIATTASTSTTTGALRVAGGAGIVGAINVGGQIRSTATTASTSTTTGALRIDGGAGIAGDLHVGGQINGTLTGSATSLATGRTISATGDISWTSGAFNGTGNVTGTATLANSGVTAGSYTNSSVTVDAKGRVTAASSGTAPVTSFSGGTTGLTPASATSGAVTLSGTLGLANGGTNATTDTAARANLKIPEYTISRGQNLVSNGFGTMRTNYNFPGFTFNGADSYFSAGSFRRVEPNAYTSGFSGEYMPVDITKSYRLSFAIKRSTPANFRVGVGFWDIDLNLITALQHQYIPNTLTTLATDLNPGDTVINLTSSANWTNSGSAASRAIVFWNYTNSLGGSYPFASNPYSRFRYPSTGVALWDSGAISGNTITLINPWSGSSFLAGTPCSNSTSGNTYKYIAINNAPVSDVFAVYSGNIRGVDLTGQNSIDSFPPGTAYCKLVFIPIAATTYDISSLSFGEDYSSLSRYSPTSDEDSTNTTSGSIVTPGGVGIAKSLIVGGSKINFANLPTSDASIAIGDLWRDGNVIKVKT